MVTLNRVEKSGDIYNVTSQEFITNNEERKDTAIKIEVYTTALMEKQMRITFAEGAGEKSVKVIRPNQLATFLFLELRISSSYIGVIDSPEAFFPASSDFIFP
jgi:uncharacterized protein YhfF